MFYRKKEALYVELLEWISFKGQQRKRIRTETQ